MLTLVFFQVVYKELVWLGVNRGLKKKKKLIGQQEH